MAKKLEDWTLKEAQIECKKHGTCNETCAFYKNGICRLEHKAPAFVDLTEEPAFTVAEMAFLEILHDNGAKWLAREEDQHLFWFAKKPQKSHRTWWPSTQQNTGGHIPDTMFQQIKWADDSPLNIEELLSNGK